MHQCSLIRPLALVHSYKNVSGCRMPTETTSTTILFFFNPGQTKKYKRPYSATSLQFLLHHACPGQQVYNFVEILTPHLWMLCSDLFLPAHIRYSYPLQNRAQKISGKLGSGFSEKQNGHALKPSYTIPNTVHSTDLLVNDLAHK